MKWIARRLGLLHLSQAAASMVTKVAAAQLINEQIRSGIRPRFSDQVTTQIMTKKNIYFHDSQDKILIERSSNRMIDGNTEKGTLKGSR